MGGLVWEGPGVAGYGGPGIGGTWYGGSDMGAWDGGPGVVKNVPNPDR